MKCTYSLVYNRTGKLNKDGKSVVQIKIYQNLGFKQVNKFITTGVKIYPKQWDSKKNEIKNHENKINLNATIKRQIADLENFELKIINSGKEFNIKMFDDFLKGKFTNSFIDFIDKELNEMQKSNVVKKSTLQTFIASYKHIKNFKDDILFNELNYNLIEDFDRKLKQRKLHQNTIYRVHKHIKYFVNKAIKKGYLEMKNNPYNHFKSKLLKTNRQYLTAKEIEKIEKFEFSEAFEHLNQIRDYFMFMFYTGLRYGDFIKLKKTDFYTNDKGDFYINILPEKTETTSNKKVYIPLKFDQKPQRIFEKYKKDNKLLLFDDFTNQYFNRELKKIAVLCEIKKELTAHVARHSFATFLLSKNIPLNIVSKLLGHSSIRTTEIYAKTLNLSIDQNLNNIDYNF